MKSLALLPALFLSFSASADLYRWVDRETGSIKFSNTPPPWFGDPEKQRGAPPVEVIPYRGPGAPPKPAERSAPAHLEAAWRKALRDVAAFAERSDIDRAMPQLQDAVRTAEALNTELKRIDPGGAAARQHETLAVMERIRRGLEVAK